MKIQRITCLIKDAFGKCSYAVCEEPSDTINIQGTTLEGDSKSFQLEVYHLPSWCAKHGFEFKIFEQEEDFDTLWNSNNE